MEALLSSDLHSHLYVGDHLHPTWRDAFYFLKNVYLNTL